MSHEVNTIIDEFRKDVAEGAYRKGYTCTDCGMETDEETFQTEGAQHWKECVKLQDKFAVEPA